MIPKVSGNERWINRIEGGISRNKQDGEVRVW